MEAWVSPSRGSRPMRTEARRIVKVKVRHQYDIESALFRCDACDVPIVWIMGDCYRNMEHPNLTICGILYSS